MNEIETREKAWTVWTKGTVTQRDRLMDLLIGDAAALFRTKDPAVMGPFVGAMKATVGFVNTKHVIDYVGKHCGLKITEVKKTGEILVEKDMTSDVWADTGAALRFIKSTPYWAWKTPSIVKDWNDPYQSMVRSYGVGLLLGEVDLAGLKTKVGEIIANAAYKAAKTSKVQTDARNKALALGREVVTLA